MVVFYEYITYAMLCFFAFSLFFSFFFLYIWSHRQFTRLSQDEDEVYGDIFRDSFVIFMPPQGV